jgi:isocitrate dehydrogenase (NAD+)
LTAQRVTLIPGDGTGPALVDAARLVLEATGGELEWEVRQVGAAVPQSETGLPDEVLDSVRRNGVALKGPVTTTKVRRGPRSVNVALRRALDLFAQVRPSRSRAGIRSPFTDVDVAVIRDTSEDLYGGVEFDADADDTASLIDVINGLGHGQVRTGSALSVKPISAAATRRVVDFALRYAVDNGYRRVTAVHKASAMRATDGLFLEVAKEVAAAVPDVKFDDMLVDSACAALVRRPQEFGVLVTMNLYGDILSDLAAALVGGIGLAAGANYGPGAALFEAAHGSAPQYAGLNKVNPMAMILSGALLLRHLGHDKAATAVEAAVEAVIAEGTTLTYDLERSPADRPPATTEEVARAVARHVAEHRPAPA